MQRVNEVRHKNFDTNIEKIHWLRDKLTSAQVIILHCAEVNISTELGAEVKIRCRSPLLGPKLFMPNIYDPKMQRFNMEND